MCAKPRAVPTLGQLRQKLAALTASSRGWFKVLVFFQVGSCNWAAAIRLACVMGRWPALIVRRLRGLGWLSLGPGDLSAFKTDTSLRFKLRCSVGGGKGVTTGRSCSAVHRLRQNSPFALVCVESQSAVWDGGSSKYFPNYGE